MTVQELYDKLAEHIKNGGAQDIVIVTNDTELTSRDCDIHEVSYVFAGTATLRRWYFDDDNDDELKVKEMHDKRVFAIY